MHICIVTSSVHKSIVSFMLKLTIQNIKIEAFLPSVLKALLTSNLVLLCCINLAFANCTSNFSYADYSGPSPAAGGVTFTNDSDGSYTGISWDFGDGNFSASLENNVDHFYAEPGNYEVCLFIWEGSQCNSTFCEEIEVSFTNGGCNNDACVFPGDANMDGVANFYDVLIIGLGIGANGPPRPNASLDFYPQPAPDWSQNTPNGINYKHLDSDGNGTINAADIDAIFPNYNPMRSFVTTNETEDIPVFVQFTQDTICVDNTTPLKVSVTAELMIGRPSQQITDLHGVAAFFRYDPNKVDPVTGFKIEYQEGFMGASPDVELRTQDLRNDEQADFGLTRTDGIGVNGSGPVARVSLDIIISDIIDGRAEPGTTGEFVLPLGAVKLIGEDGNEKEIHLSYTPAKVVFLKKSDVTSVNDPDLLEKVDFFPNPVQDELNIQLDGIRGERIELYNVFGQRLLNLPFNDVQTQLNLSDYADGIYLVNVYTTEGLVSKKILVR